MGRSVVAVFFVLACRGEMERAPADLAPEQARRIEDELAAQRATQAAGDRAVAELRRKRAAEERRRVEQRKLDRIIARDDLARSVRVFSNLGDVAVRAVGAERKTVEFSAAACPNGWVNRWLAGELGANLIVSGFERAVCRGRGGDLAEARPQTIDGNLTWKGI